MRLDAFRQHRKPAPIENKRNVYRRTLADEQGAQIGGAHIQAGSVVSLNREQIHDLLDARRRIETDGITRPSAALRVIRKHECQPPVTPRLLPETHPGRGEPCNVVDAIGSRLVPSTRIFETGIQGGVGLERDGAREEPAVKLGQHHVHRDIGRAEPAWRRLPCFL